MRKQFTVLLAYLLMLGLVAARAQVKISPLSSFGNNGWLAPGSIANLTVNDTERGLAYGNDHLYLVSRNGGNAVRILNPVTGADLGSLNMTGIPAPGTGGATFAVNMAAVGGDGAIYVGNLTVNANTSPFVIYKWANESSAPTLAYNGTPLAGARVGDTLAAVGSGASTRLVAGFSSNPSVTGNNSYAIVDPAAQKATKVDFSGMPPNAGDFRLGLTFGPSADEVLGSQSGGVVRATAVSGSTGTFVTSLTLHDTSERLVAFANVGGMSLLAAESTTDAHVSLYDVSNLSKPVYLGSANATTGNLHANTHDVGQLAWGNITGNTAVLYAMSTDQGIQAFTVMIPEPGVLTLGAIGSGLLMLCSFRRRTRS
jgi:hypothetical protein